MQPAEATTSETGRLEQLPAWALAVIGAFVCLVIYVPTATWDYAQVNDNEATAIAAWSLADHGSIQVDESWPDVPWARQGPDGNWYIWRHPGGIVWGALFYLVSDLTIEPTRATEVNYAPATASVVLATAFGIGVMILIFRRFGSGRQALLAGLLLGLGTANWSVSAAEPWNHGPTLLFLSLGLLFSAHERWASSGLAWAASITVRPHVAVAAAAVGLAEGWRRRKPSIVVTVGLISAVGLAVTIWFYGALFGEWTMRQGQFESFFTGDVSSTALSWPTNLLYWFFHPARGLFLYSPFLLVLLPALPAGWRVAPTWARAGGVAAVLYALIQTRSDVYHAGFDFFGYRGPLETLTLAAPLLFLAYREWAPRDLWRAAFNTAAVGSVVIFALGVTVLDPIRRFDTHCAVENYVGPYRPEEEKTAAEERRQRECPRPESVDDGSETSG